MELSRPIIKASPLHRAKIYCRVNTQYPKISIITPSYNQGDFIEKTIQSVLNQNYPNLEYIIIDGGSKDNSVDIIKKYEKNLTYWVSEKDNGQSEALNKGFKKASGEIIAWINSDDWYEGNVFEIVANYFRNSGASIIAGNCKMIYEGAAEKNFIDKPGKITSIRMLQYWKPFFCPPQPSIFFKNEALEKAGYINETLSYGMDLDLWLRLSKKYKFKYVDILFANYLIHDASKSGSSNGFEKFVPEWKSVVKSRLNDFSFFTKFIYWILKRTNHVVE